MSRTAHRYVKRGLHSVHGWLNPVSGQVISAVSEVQREFGVVGSSAEIGVHHGKLMLLLMLLNPDQAAYAIDIFDRQDLNIDHSGKGNKAIFLRHVDKIVGPHDLRIIEDSSMNVTVDQLSMPARLFSVDGGHTVECTMHDLRLAAESLTDGGIIILDDAFNEAWPEVADGLSRYLSANPKVVPFALSPNKVYLTQLNWCDRYRASLRANMPKLFDRSLRVFGTEVDIYGVSAASRDYAVYAAHAINRIRGIAARLIPAFVGVVGALRTDLPIT